MLLCAVCMSTRTCNMVDPCYRAARRCTQRWRAGPTSGRRWTATSLWRSYATPVTAKVHTPQSCPLEVGVAFSHGRSCSMRCKPSHPGTKHLLLRSTPGVLHCAASQSAAEAALKIFRSSFGAAVPLAASCCLPFTPRKHTASAQQPACSVRPQLRNPSHTGTSIGNLTCHSQDP